MEINIWSPKKVIPQDLLRTKISWLAHDLDKTINAQINPARFKQVASSEARKLENFLIEWKNRGYSDDELIIWARGVSEEYSHITTLGKEADSVEVDFKKFDSEQVFSLMKSRRSIRRWQDKPIPRDILAKVLEAGQWAPSACNRQSCRYIVLESKEQKQYLVALREEWLENAPVLIFIGADKRNYLPVEYNYVPYMDASMAAQNVLLMAHAQGLGAVIVKTSGWDMLEGRSYNYSNKIIDLYENLNIPSYFIPVAIVALGYPLRIPKEPKRLPFESVVFYEKYEVSAEQAEELKYCDLIENVQSQGEIVNGMSSKFLVKAIIKRVAKKALKKIGF